MNKRVLLLGCLLALASQVQSASRTEVWVWTDADGVKHYSDYPAPGARKLTLATDSAQGGATAPPIVSSPPANAGMPPSTKYKSLEILMPRNETSFFEADTEITVRVQSEPEITGTDKLMTFLDNKIVNPPDSYEHTLTNVERGAHMLVAVISDAGGNEKLRSEPVVFYVKQPTIVTNPRNVGPALKPKPTPHN
jgi:hypothetical protein